jgi:competence protein ComGF
VRFRGKHIQDTSSSKSKDDQFFMRYNEHSYTSKRGKIRQKLLAMIVKGR